MLVFHIIAIYQYSYSIKYPLDERQNQLVVLIIDLHLTESTAQILGLDSCVHNVLNNLLQGLQEVVRVMYDAPSILCGQIDSELSWFHPAPIEVDLDLVLAIVEDGEEKHVDEVLES